ncbi:COG3904 family protein [Oceanomicrobium pacificus]|uniref:Periplasmic protein-like protein n=1 Tax=Oceanomicrobium pacificus TaxID=2692916 RepID=A0A6B0TW04_9RHOB|nr:hypothetical protein [Oceanomicrobium pacificus]MXU65173.1 hypothetical protein [Oceanomicrobium pacificus]
MTDTADSQAPAPAVADGRGIRRGLRFFLVLQILVAGLLVATDAMTRWDFSFRPSPDLPTGPVTPGDQTRRYEPSQPSPDFARPGTEPMFDMPSDMPDRLTFTDLPPEGGLDRGLVHGPIEPGDAERFATWLAARPDAPDRIAFNSPGGALDEALVIGRTLREAGIETDMLPGMICLSACPYMFAGGTARRVSSDAAVGMHQSYYETPGYLPAFIAVEDIQHAQGRVMDYLIEMGIDPGVMIHSLRTPPDEIYVLLEDELTDSRLATEITD